MSLTGTLRSTLSARAPRIEEAAVRANWRRRNRNRAYQSGATEPLLAPLAETLARDGVLITDAATVFGDMGLYEEAAAAAWTLYEQPRVEPAPGEGEKGTFLTKLATGSCDVDHPFAQLALHPHAIAIANSYLGLRSTLRALDVWLTRPTSGPAIQTQLWHRDGDDVMNVKMFVYFTETTPKAGPLCYARGTHPRGKRRSIPEHDEHLRTTDEQMQAVAPESAWLLCEGRPGTVVFADTCGYHKQLKPESDERMLLMAHYVSGTPFVPRAVEITGADASALTDDQYVAVFDRVRP